MPKIKNTSLGVFDDSAAKDSQDAFRLEYKEDSTIISLVLNDLRTKLRLFLQVRLSRKQTRLQQLKEATKDNIICDFLKPYVEDPRLIALIPSEIFDDNKEFLCNLPIVLNELRDFLLERQGEVLEAQACELKSAAVAAHNAHTNVKTEFISKNWVEVSRKVTKVPKLIEEFKPERIQKYFPLTMHNRLLADLDKLEDSRLKLNRMSDYWKQRIQTTAEFLGDLHKPLEQSKFGNKFVKPKVRQMIEDNIYEKIPFVKPILTK